MDLREACGSGDVERVRVLLEAEAPLEPQRDEVQLSILTRDPDSILFRTDGVRSTSPVALVISQLSLFS
jgi:hypothetical protein